MASTNLELQPALKDLLIVTRNQTNHQQLVEHGITPTEFTTNHGSVTFDFNKSMKEFKNICEDYEEKLSMDEASQAVEFCSKMIYEVEPESRRLSDDMVWRFGFPCRKSDKVKFAFVAFFKDPSKELGEDTFTVKHACLLAISTLERINNKAIYKGSIVITPSAAAVFAEHDVRKLAAELEVQPIEVVHSINSSCQSGGEYLKNSQLHIAVIAVIVVTANVADAKIRDEIIGKTVQQYLNQKKPWYAEKFIIYSKFARGGGVPSSLFQDILTKLKCYEPNVTSEKAEQIYSL